MTTFTHKITNVQTTSIGDLADVVHTVRLEIVGEANGKTHKNFFPITLGAPDSGNFVDFSKLTEEQVLAWAKEVIGQDEITALENGIDGILNAPTDTSPTAKPILQEQSLPWSTN